MGSGRQEVRKGAAQPRRSIRHLHAPGGCRYGLPDRRRSAWRVYSGPAESQDHERNPQMTEPVSPAPSNEPSVLDLSTPRDNLRWALAALELVANGLRNRHQMTDTNVEIINLRAARDSVSEALRIIRSTALSERVTSAASKDDLERAAEMADGGRVDRG